MRVCNLQISVGKDRQDCLRSQDEITWQSGLHVQTPKLKNEKLRLKC